MTRHRRLISHGHSLRIDIQLKVSILVLNVRIIPIRRAEALGIPLVLLVVFHSLLDQRSYRRTKSNFLNSVIPR